ncbi:GNAT family N-acetyltransferase [Mycobacterium sp. SMC-14]|uniref:GNAT family N-acetyltransferase n=1 Tax=Mycobacterium sp. SMC-14 TaxID=3385968 RepID=UPI00390CC4FC
MNYEGPILLGADHLLEDFDCGSAALNEWLRTKALSNQREGGSRAWVVLDGRRVVAFYASSTAVLLRSHATKRAARNQPDPLPAVLLGRLAVDTAFQGRGLAAALLKHFVLKSLEIAEATGVRLLLVHAKYDAAQRFYVKYGFEPSVVDDMTLLLLVKDVRHGFS